LKKRPLHLDLGQVAQLVIQIVLGVRDRRRRSSRELTIVRTDRRKSDPDPERFGNRGTAGRLCAILWRSLAALPAPPIAGHSALLAIAGLLVGFGTRLGSGCTSGHGICGISRLSPRFLVATALFMPAGFATVFITRHVIGW